MQHADAPQPGIAGCMPPARACAARLRRYVAFHLNCAAAMRDSHGRSVMPLHTRDEIRSELYGDVYASNDLCVALPKYKMPDFEHAPDHVYALVHDELMLDGNSRMNLAT